MVSSANVFSLSWLARRHAEAPIKSMCWFREMVKIGHLV